MTMKLYTFPLSSNARKAEMVVHILGTEVERVIVNLAAGEQKKPDYLALNTNGRVPTLVDGDFVLWESNAIMAYLADKTPGNTLYPSELRARADVNRWLFWQANHLSPAIGALTFEHLLKARFHGGEPDPVQIKRNEDFVRQFGAVLDAHLAEREWVSGSTLTIADIGLAASMMYEVPAKLPLESFAHLQKWFGRMRELPAWKKTEPPPFPG
jgi:glutathione S-transferase